MVADAAEVRRALTVFADPDAGCEVISLTAGIGRTRHGNDIDGLAEAVDGLPAGIGIYFRINPVLPILSGAAKDRDILSRRWLYIDADPVKPGDHKDDPATDDEKERTRKVMEAVNEYLSGCGWPAPVITDSGNGFGLFFRVELPNDELSRSLVKRVLYSLAEKFSGPNGIIDKSTHNAGRLAKLPGTWARKGTEFPERPYRVAKLLYVPDALEPVDIEAIQLVAGTEAETPKEPTPEANGKAHEHPYKKRATSGGEAAYGKAALDRECARVYLAQPGTRNNALNRAAFSLGQLVAGGVLNEAEVIERLTDAARRCGLDKDAGGERAIRDTIQRGLVAGKEEPRRPKEKPNSNEAKAKQASEATASGGVIYWASTVTPRKVEWLWPGRIPLGKLTTFAGNGGLGKTFVLCDLAARVTQGLDWPDSQGECQQAGKCLFISGEDDPDDTLVPRMIEAGANLGRIAFLQTAVLNAFTLADLDTLDKALKAMGPETRFVAIDPPTAYLGDVNDHKNAELRGLLTPLMLWAKEHRLAVVFNTHVNKPQGAKVEAVMRVMGSVAWVNAVRSAYMFARDPEDGERRLFVGMKNNLGKEIKGLAYRILSTESLARVEWLGEVDTSADEAVNNQSGTKRKRSVVASEWLAELFADVDKLPSKIVFTRQDSETTLSKNALKEAKEEMGIRARQECDDEGDRQWYWYWPKDARSAWEAKHGAPEPTE